MTASHLAAADHGQGLPLRPRITRTKDYLSAGEVAALLGVDRTTVNRWGRAGILPPAVRVLGGAHYGPVAGWDAEAVRAFGLAHGLPRPPDGQTVSQEPGPPAPEGLTQEQDW